MDIVVIFLLTLLNGTFSMSEIALVSSKKFKLETAVKKGNKNARKALELAEKPNTFLSTVQMGITLVGILMGVYSGENITADLRKVLSLLPVLAPYSQSLSVFLVVLLITYVSIVFGELIPKAVGLAFPESIASAVAGPMTLISKITRPFIWLLARSSNLVLQLFGIQETRNHKVTEEEIKSIVAEGKTLGEVQEIEEEIVKRVFTLGDLQAGQLMTHRSELTYIDIKDDLTEIKRKIGQDPHPVYLLVDKNPDKLLGTVSIDKIFNSSLGPGGLNLDEIMQKAVYVQENMAAYKVLERFKEHRVHMVVVVDEYGSIEGVLSVNDVLDALVGDIVSRLGDDPEIIRRDDDSWLADGQLPFYKFINYLGLEDVEDAEGFTTLAGLILKNSNHYPTTGEKITWKELEFEIMDMDDRRIDKVLIKKINS